MKEKISLQEQMRIELERYNSINRYTQLLYEQATPPEGADAPEPDMTAPDAAPTDAPPPEGGDVAGGGGLDALDNLGGGGGGAPPEGGGAGESPADGVTPEIPEDTTQDDTTEEIDITDLVNMTKNIKQELEKKETDSGSVIAKMNGVFQQLQNLESRLGEMDKIIAKIDELSGRVEKMRPPTPQEKLEMRSLDSGPFKEKPQEFFDNKKEEMQRSGKNEYVLTPDDVKNYSKNEIMKSFNPDIDV